MEKKDSKKSIFNVNIDKFIQSKNQGLKNVEQLRVALVKKLDSRINELYKKRNFVLEVITHKKELQLKKISVWKNIIANTFWTNCKVLISVPFIYTMIFPTVFFHLGLEIYHQVCFRLYRIPLVNRKEYFIFDRRHLPYLNWLEKINCAYCTYFNCLIGYAREIGGRTERFWCPIKHAMNRKDPHSQYNKFVDYSDAKTLRKEWKNLRKFEENNKKKN